MALRNIFIRRNVVPYKDLQAEGQSSDQLQLGVDLPVQLSLMEGLAQDEANIVTVTSVDSPTSIQKPKRTDIDVSLGQILVPTTFFEQGVIANGQILCTVIDDRMTGVVYFIDVIDMGAPATGFLIRVDLWNELMDKWFNVSFVGGNLTAVGTGDDSNPYFGIFPCNQSNNFTIPRMRLRADISGVGQTPTVIVSGYKMY